MIILPLIDTTKCMGCGLCVTVCLGEGRAVVNKVAIIVHPEMCVWCTQCETVCPAGAATCPFDVTIERRISSRFL